MYLHMRCVCSRVWRPVGAAVAALQMVRPRIHRRGGPVSMARRRGVRLRWLLLHISCRALHAVYLHGGRERARPSALESAPQRE